MEIKSLEGYSFEEIYQGFKRAFADYEIHFDKEEVKSILIRRGFDPRLSFAAFDNGEIVAFTLNGIGRHNGCATAYDTGTGTALEYRGGGLAPRIFQHSLPYLREAGIRQYLLEVLQSNEKAINLYRRMGFVVTRELLCFRQDIDKITDLDRTPVEIPVVIRQTDVDSIGLLSGYCDCAPSWQNSLDSINRGKANLICLAACRASNPDSAPIGYCVLDPATGDITQIAVSPDYRRKGVATLLLREAIDRMTISSIKILNIDPVDSTLPSFLEDHNILPSASQYEMILPL